MILSGSSSFALPGWLPLSAFVWAVQMLVYHAVGLGFEWVDQRGLFRACRVRPADRRGYRALLPRVLANQVLLLLPAMMLVEWAGLAFTGPAHLSLVAFIGGMVLMGIGHDIVQYVFHRYVLHRPSLLFVLGHNIHHSTGASRSLSACFMSGPDFFLEIVLPYLVPLVVIGGGGADVSFHCLVAGLGAIGGLYEHSGYDFTLVLRGGRLAWLGNLLSSHAHGEHHRRSNVSFSDGFGSPGLCDTLFATRWDKVEAPRRGRPLPQSESRQ